MVTSVTRTGSTSVTVSLWGRNFGESNLAPTVTVGSTSCSATWTSDTSLKCSVAAGTGTAHTITAVVDSQSVSVTNAFSYSGGFLGRPP